MNAKQSMQRMDFLVRKAGEPLKKYGIRFTAKKVRRKLMFHFAKPRLLRAPLFTQEQLERQRKDVFPRKITFSILVPLYNTPENFLREMIESVQAQTYGDWELCLADGSAPEFGFVETICREYAKADSRIIYRKLEKNLGISGNTNACLEFASGDYIALFDHDDVLHPAALHQMMEAICAQGADYVYTDEAIFVGTLDHITTVHCKSNFSVDNLRANNYICHFSAFSREVLEKTGLFRKEYDGSQDHDFILRATENAEKIVHIPQILYYWRSHPNSVAQDISSKSYAIDAGIRAVRDSLARHGIQAEVTSSPRYPAIYRIRYPLNGEPMISVIVAVTDAAQAESCARAVLAGTSYLNFELILTGSAEVLETVKISDSRLRKLLCSVSSETEMRNFAAKEAVGTYLLFLSERILEVSPDWMQEMLMFAQREDVGCVGPKVYDRGRNVLESGLVLGYGVDGIGSPFRGTVEGDDGYMGRLYYPQTYAALSGTCLMVSAEHFRQLDGFRPNFTAHFAAADLCLRSGLKTVWTPHAELHTAHRIGSKMEPEQLEAFRTVWKARLEGGDPWYSRNANCYLEDFLGTGKIHTIE